MSEVKPQEAFHTQTGEDAYGNDMWGSKGVNPDYVTFLEDSWNTRPSHKAQAEGLEELAVKVADGSVLIPNIIAKWAKVKRRGLDPTMYATGSYEGDCKIIDEQRQFFDDLYLLLSKIIDIDPECLPEPPKGVKNE